MFFNPPVNPILHCLPLLLTRGVYPAVTVFIQREDPYDNSFDYTDKPGVSAGKCQWLAAAVKSMQTGPEKLPRDLLNSYHLKELPDIICHSHSGRYRKRNLTSPWYVHQEVIHTPDKDKTIPMVDSFPAGIQTAGATHGKICKASFVTSPGNGCSASCLFGNNLHMIIFVGSLFYRRDLTEAGMYKNNMTFSDNHYDHTGCSRPTGIQCLSLAHPSCRFQSWKKQLNSYSIIDQDTGIPIHNHVKSLPGYSICLPSPIVQLTALQLNNSKNNNPFHYFKRALS